MMGSDVRSRTAISVLLGIAGFLLLLVPWARAVEFTTDTTINSSDHAGEDLIVTGCTLTINCTGGRGSYRSLLVRSSGRVTHPAGSENGLWLTFSNDVQVDGWCKIDVNGKGHPAQSGPGAGSHGGGGGYGGQGQANESAVYGDIRAPEHLGSGGGDNGANGGGAGGGSVRLEVGGTVTLNGAVEADGTGATLAGSGSGGTVFITCGALAGGGPIVARGGASETTGLPDAEAAGGGGGGRIALVAASISHTGQVWAHGGTGRCWGADGSGGPGTVYWAIGVNAPVLVYHNGGRTGVTVQPALNMPDTVLQVHGSHGMVFDCTVQPLSVVSLLVADSSTVSHPAGSAAGLHVITSGNLQIDGWCYLNVSGRGHAAQLGPGAGSSGTGGGYGGQGQANGAAVYGSITAPGDLGSGGGNNGANSGGAGGGLVRLEVGGTLTLGGTILADGAGASLAGSGSGGSVYITCAAMAGGAGIYARGGDSQTSGLPDSEAAGGGGGGRIAIVAASSSYTGEVWAHGGTGRCWAADGSGGPGTVYWATGISAPVLVYHNGGRTGVTVQPALSMPDTALEVRGAHGMVFDCTVQPLSVLSLLVASNSTVSHPSGSAAGLHVVTVGNLQIDGWCYLNVSGKGLPAETGLSAGANGTGGGYGGQGQANGKPVYGSVTAPSEPGSGGGNRGATTGGAGGGVIRLEVGGQLTHGGAIYADGAGVDLAGSGAGGSVHITCGAIAGGGSIYARGGSSGTNGLPDWEAAGGGGGGRIAVVANSTSFSGEMWAHGGTGRCWGANGSGGPGSVYRKLGADPPYLLFHNAGFDGTSVHPAVNMPDTALEVRGSRGMVFDCGAQPLSVLSFLVAGNSTVTHPAGSTAGLHVITSGNVQIDGWCRVHADGRGYGSETGPGGGGANQGGAYGGNGGNGNARTYGLLQCPNELGSGGGNDGAALGGAGGGRIRFSAGGSIIINGTVDCYGDSVSGGGAGSGGSVLLSAASISGGGGIYARGGSSNSGGGGGGGRIACYVPAGAQALPGGGANVEKGAGGSPQATDGTVYLGERSGVPVDLTFDAGPAFQWHADGTGTASVRVLNLGDLDSPGFVVEMFDRDPSLPGAVLLDTVPIATLPGPGAADLTLQVDPPMQLTQVWIIADRANNVAEGREDNNVITMDVSRVPTSLYVLNREGTVTEPVTLRGYLKRTTDNAWLVGKTVTYSIDGTVVGSGVTDANGRADYVWIITSGPQTRTITGVFAGDDTYAYCTGNGTLTARVWATKMATFDRTARITDRTELKCRLLRSDNVPLYNKTINFYVDGSFVISRPTNVQGYASYPYYTVPDGPGAGVRTILSEWPGDGGYLPVSKAANLTVMKAIPYIWVLPKSVPQGSIANLYAYFRRLYDYQKQESKPVSFRIDGTWIADVTTGTGSEGGVARCLYPTAGLGLGVHTIRCEFAGDPWVDAGYGEGNLTIY